MNTTEQNVTETWEQREQRREQEKQAAIVARRELYNAVAAHLPGWHVTESDDEYLGYRFKLEDGLGHRVTIESARERGKWHVSGYWLGTPGAGANGRYLTPSDVSESYPSINLSQAKTPEQIARDIARRFLPEYLRIFAKLEAKQAADNDYDTRRARNWKRITDSGYVKYHALPHLKERADVRIKSNADGSTNYDAGYGEVHMESVDSVRLELRSLPVETALAVLELLQKGWR